MYYLHRSVRKHWVTWTPIQYKYIFKCLIPQERTKALGYLDTNQRAAGEALKALDEAAAMRPPDNVNELHIKVIRCSKLKARRGGKF